MADKIVQLVDKDGNNIYPIASVPNGARITMTDVDPGEGSPLAADNYIAVYGDDPREFDYSLNEVNTGVKWIDGKSIYKKTIDFGALPNNTNKQVAHNISGLDMIVKVEQHINNGPNHPKGFLILSSGPANVTEFNIYGTDTTISVTTNADKSFAYAYFTLYYTKN